jgi:hypothetical protein
VSDERERQLKMLVLDDDFNNIQTLVNEEINLMSILRVEHRELQHSNLLAWLFNPNESHGLGEHFIKEFIKLYYKGNDYQDLGVEGNRLSVFDFVRMDFDDLEIKREHKNIDLLLLSKSNKLCIVIENKIFSHERDGQLLKYKKLIDTDFNEYQHKVFIYLSLLGQEISESASDSYVQITYENIKEILATIVQGSRVSVNRNTQFVITQYLQTLRTLMNENKEIEEIAKKLYGKYKPAFDLVFKYVSPSQSPMVPNNLLTMIEQESSIRSFSSNRSYVRFQPNFLYENIEKLKSKGFIHKNDDLTNSWLFLFEFNVTRTHINFDMKIGMYDYPECREKLFELYKNNEKVFNKINRGSGKLSAKWHIAFQRNIVTKQQYEDYVKSDDGTNLENLIQSGFRRVIREDLPRIASVLLGSQK